MASGPEPVRSRTMAGAGDASDDLTVTIDGGIAEAGVTVRDRKSVV
jgi:hypothetical protein